MNPETEFWFILQKAEQRSVQQALFCFADDRHKMTIIHHSCLNMLSSLDGKVGDGFENMIRESKEEPEKDNDN